ncbi:hypothetical protein GCM10009555_107000 [Acrocarpospora macrocephala]|uniref:Uncharacterized protein n=1 Tax=Acrocarpospora macrocephala TaxID=150177 RepID=A0A5M3X330_9ACTN|nr:hypothetical protein [Acrocarpospora macrocephala]GES15012.1 hypothetical protein Amac_086090 [Acrocarpospora macrocephala]
MSNDKPRTPKDPGQPPDHRGELGRRLPGPEDAHERNRNSEDRPGEAPEGLDETPTEAQSSSVDDPAIIDSDYAFRQIMVRGRADEYDKAQQAQARLSAGGDAPPSFSKKAAQELQDGQRDAHQSLIDEIPHALERQAIQLEESEGHFDREPDKARIREISVRIYIENDETSPEGVASALEEVLAEHEFTISQDLDTLHGSWFRTLIARTKRSLTRREAQEQMDELVDKLQRAAELRLIHSKQAEVDSAQGSTVAALISSLEGTSDASIQVGSILLAKISGTIYVRNLTQRELVYIEHHPTLLAEPSQILAALEKAPEISTRSLEPPSHQAQMATD